MKALDVLQQLYQTVPDLTDLFSNSIDVATASASGGTTVTITTATVHNIEDQSFVNVSELSYPTPIASVTRFVENATVITSENHDLTDGFQETVTLSGVSEAEFNGTFTLLAVPNRNTFVIQVEDIGPIDATGGFLEEDTGFKAGELNGLVQITLVDSTTFTYEVSDDITFSQTGVGVLTVGYRMGAAINAQSVLDMYTEQQASELWLFVVIGNVRASKDRKNNSDAVYSFNTKSGYRQETIHELEVYIIANASDQISATTIRDEMEDIAVILTRCLCNAHFDNGNTSKDYFATVFDSHVTAFYDKATYMHVFNFQSVGQINDGDVSQPGDGVAFRDVFLEDTYFPKNIG